METSGAPYYERNKEARKAYQRDYYARNRAALKRKRELDSVLSPDSMQKVREYQRNYYLTNRDKLLERKRLQYHARKSKI